VGYCSTFTICHENIDSQCACTRRSAIISQVIFKVVGYHVPSRKVSTGFSLRARAYFTPVA
jgi:hypothetical protein